MLSFRILSAFGWGGLAAVYLAIPANSAITSIMAKTGSPELAAEWGPAIAGPSVEETLKILGVILLVLVARTQFPTISSAVSGAMRCSHRSARSASDTS